MKKEEFFEYCLEKYATSPDYPFNDNLETAVFRHKDNAKWFAIMMQVSCCKFGFTTDQVTDVVNFKIPLEMQGAFGAKDGVYPAYHMNKQHWVSVLIADAQDDTIKLLLDVSFEATKSKKRK